MADLELEEVLDVKLSKQPTEIQTPNRFCKIRKARLAQLQQQAGGSEGASQEEQRQ